MRHAPPDMSPLEIAFGAPVGLGPDTRLPDVRVSPMAALEDAVTTAVARPPCCVAFSGGRDSSLVLAAAVHAAARHGCEQPVALTVRFRGATETDEAVWQDMVLDHLGIENRVVLDVGGDLDLVGPVAVGELRRRGVLFPANSHGLMPLVRHAAGGSLLVGLGGDELLSGHRWTRLNDVLARRSRPSRGDAGRLLVAAMPSALRGRVLARRSRNEAPRWLRRRAARSLRSLERAQANQPVRFDRAVGHAARERTVLVASKGLRRLSDATNVEAPLLDPRFVAALSRAGGRHGWGDRSAAMRAIAAGVLPDAVLARRDKAHFDAMYFGTTTRRFAEAWTGGGVDTALIDPDLLRTNGSGRIRTFDRRSSCK